MKGTRWSVRLFRAAVRVLLPSWSRDELGSQVESTGVRLLDDARSEGGALREARTLARELSSLTALALRERTTGRDESSLGGEGTVMMGQDVRFAFRMLTRNPGTTVASLLTLALGIGAVTAVFSAVNGVLLDPLDYRRPERVVLVGERGPSGGYSSLSWENFRDWQESDVFDAVAAFSGTSVSVSGEGAPERIRGLFVSASYFDVVGIRPALGRAIEAGEDEPGGPRVAVLSWGWWQERFGGDPDVLGRTIRLNNEPHTIVGVMPRGFRSPFDTPSAWISLQTAPRDLDRSSRDLQAIALLREGDDAATAGARLGRVAAGLAERYPDANEGWGAWAIRLDGWVSGRYRPLLLGLLAAVAVLLLIAGANVAGLQLARTEARTRELAVRAALGGSRGRLVRQLLVENGLLVALGGALGLGLSFFGVDGLVALNPGLDAFFDVGVDGRVLAAGVGVTSLVALGFGLLPALAAGRLDPGTLLAGRGGATGRRGARARSALVVGQVALSLALLVSAGLLVRSMMALGRVDPGFDTDKLLTAEFRLTGERYDTPDEIVAFFDQVVDRIAKLPGVEGVTTAQHLPFGDRGTIPFILEGTEPDLDRAPRVELSRIMPGYVKVMGMKLLRGRGLDADAGLDDPVEAVVGETTARELVPGDALGRSFYISEDLRVARIVGVVSDVSLSLTEGPARSVYLNQRQDPSAFASLAVRTGGEPMQLARPVREAVWSVDPDQPVWEVMPIQDRMAATVAGQRFGMTLLSFFGVLAALLAAVGIYGVMAHTVGARTRELGVRLALGAMEGRVLRLVLVRAATLVAGGVVVGLLLAWWSATLLDSLLFGVTSRDPLTFAAAVVLLATVAFLAAWLPARRATRVDPVRTLQDT